MFPRFQKPRLPNTPMGEQNVSKFEIPAVRHPLIKEGKNVAYPGKFEKPHAHKPRVHKRY